MDWFSPSKIYKAVTPEWLQNLLDPNNPFIPYVLLLDLIILLAHVYAIYWVYKDAMRRYNRGAPWALLTAIFPLGGWLTYLLYRRSPLVELDRLDAELFDDEYEWTDYDEYKRNQSAKAFQELTSFWKLKERSGYSPWVRESRRKELKKKLTPEEIKSIREQKRRERAEKLKQRVEEKKHKREKRKELAQQARERQTMTGAHGFKFKMSDRRQDNVRKKLELLDKLKKLPREDHNLEDLIYQMEYRRALKAAREALLVAEEMNDEQGVITYKHYVEKISRILSEAQDRD